MFARALAKKAGELTEEMVGNPSIVTGEPLIEVDAHPILTPGCGPVHHPS